MATASVLRGREMAWHAESLKCNSCIFKQFSGRRWCEKHLRLWKATANMSGHYWSRLTSHLNEYKEAYMFKKNLYPAPQSPLPNPEGVGMKQPAESHPTPKFIGMSIMKFSFVSWFQPSVVLHLIRRLNFITFESWRSKGWSTTLIMAWGKLGPFHMGGFSPVVNGVLTPC